jgi:HAE1 family hydrophobic/amphiphilic exporter-1
MLSKIFIQRPILAGVIAIVMTLVGGLAIIVLPIEQYPEIAPPTIQVSAIYPGADARTVTDTVAAPIEQEVNGVEGMIYMSSISANDGSYVLTVTFELGTDVDMASVQVQNRVAIAEPRLPQEVRQQGVTTRKRSQSMLMVLSPHSPDGRYDQLFLSNYATIYMKDALARVPGVGQVTVFGAKDFSMRVWLDPEKLAARDLTTVDVLDALREQNVQVAAGRIGAEPAADPYGFQLSMQTKGTVGLGRGVREHRAAGRGRPAGVVFEGCGPGGAGGAELRFVRTVQRHARAGDFDIPIARLERAGGG